MKRSSRIKPISYLKAHVAKIVRSLGDRREPLIITQNGEAKGVLRYATWKRSAITLSSTMRRTRQITPD